MGRHTSIGGPDVRHTGVATSAVAQTHTQTNSIGVQCQAECWGCRVYNWEGGWSIERPKTWGRGGSGPLISCFELWRRNLF